MKKIFTLLAIAVVFGTPEVFAQEDDVKIIFSDHEFEPGTEERMYGDRVVFRKKPDTESNALDTLAIGATVEIVKKVDETIVINGLECNWYKVKYNGKSGYVPGGFIALDHKTVGAYTYLVIYAGSDDPAEFYEKRMVRCRVLEESGNYFGHEIGVYNTSFYLEAFENRGVKGIQGIVCINLVAEACGVDGGEIYLFNDGERLVKVIELSSVADGGVFWYNESITFPEDGYWGENILYFEREYGEMVDEELNLTKATLFGLPLEWKDGVLFPDVETIDFDSYELEE